MKSSYIGMLIIALIVVSCGETGSDTEAHKNTPTYNMIASHQNLSGIWSWDMLRILDKSSILDLDFGMAGLMAKGMIDKISDQDEAGIDFSGKAYFAATHTDDFDFNYTFTFYPVTNREKVYKTIKSSIGMLVAGKHGSKGDFDTYYTEMGTVGVWDENHLVVVASPDKDKEALLDIAVDILDSRYIDAVVDSRIEDFLSLDDDVSCFIDISKSLRMGQAKSKIVSTPEMLEAMADAFVIGHGNFNAGDMTFSADVNAPEFAKSELNPFQDKGVGGDLIDFVTTNESIQVGTINLNMNRLVKMIEGISLEGEDVLSNLSKLGLERLEFEKLLSGEVAFSVINVTTKKVDKAKTTNEDDFDDFFADESYSDFMFDAKLVPEVVLGFRLKDVDKTTSVLSALPTASKENGKLKLGDFYAVFKADKLALTTSLDAANQIESGANLNSKKIAISAEEHAMPLFGYFNTDISSYSAEVQGLLEDQFEGVNMTELMVVDGIKGMGDASHFEFKIEMKNKEENALGIVIQALYGSYLTM
ncbi:MAG: hypothetical protein ACI9J3_001474 [Parvicellaceae bacterium]|jgi:hypothetical protein